MFPITLEQFREAYEKTGLYPVAHTWAKQDAIEGVGIVGCACPMTAIMVARGSEFPPEYSRLGAAYHCFSETGIELGFDLFTQFVSGVDFDNYENNLEIRRERIAHRGPEHLEAFDAGREVRLKLFGPLRDRLVEAAKVKAV